MPGPLGIIAGFIGARKSNKELEKLIGADPSYSANPIAGRRLAFANQLLNARMPGAADVEKNLLSNQATQISNINKVATDSGQAIALASGVQGKTNDAVMGLGEQEAGDYQRRYNNVVGAEDAVTNENDKVFADRIRKFQDLAAIRGAQNQNRMTALQGIGQFEDAAMNVGASLLGGGFFGNKK